jgi:Fic family protein
MKRFPLGLVLLSSAALGESCWVTCPESSSPNNTCSFIGPDRVEDASAPFGAMLQRSMLARPSAQTFAAWDALRERYQRAHETAPDTVDQALLAMRFAGSVTLARSSEAQAGFARAAARASAIARAGRAPTAIDMHALHALVAPGHQPGTLRGPSQQARAGHDTQRDYLPGALVAEAVEDTFELLGSPRARTLEAPELAALVDQRLISAHPYVDGNGRVARLVADSILERDGFPPVVVSSSAALHWKRASAVDARAHIDRITDGIRRSVEIAEAVSRA